MRQTVFAPKLRMGAPEPLPPRAPAGGAAKKAQERAPSFAFTPGGFTPRRVLGIFREAEAGYPQQMFDLFEHIIEADGHLRSQIETRVDSVAGKEWIIQAGGESAEDDRAAKLLEEACREVPNFGEMVEHQLLSVPYGWSPTEITWGRATNKAIAPLWFDNVPAQAFVFNKFDEPLLRRDGTIEDALPLEPGGWIQSRRRSRIAVKAGLMRTATWWALFKQMAVRDWVALAERFGLPVPIGKYRDDMPEDEKAAVRKAVAMIGREGWGAMSESATIDFAKVDYGGGQEIHPTLASFCNQEISKLITGATLTSGEGTSTGSYALGRVHENVAFTLVLSDAMRLASTFARDIGAPFIRWNGLSAKPPRLRINVIREIDPTAQMDLYCRAANELGVKVDEDQFRQLFQMKYPVGTKGSTLIGTAKAAAGDAPAAPTEPAMPPVQP